MMNEPMGGRRYPFKSKADRLAQYQTDKAIRDEIFKNKMPFITPSFLPNFYLCQGLIVVGGESGRAKSTTCANVVAGFLKYTTDKTCIVISNEENSDAIYERIACCMLKLNYTSYYNGTLSSYSMGMVDAEVETIAERVEVVTEGDGWDMSVLEDVQAVLDSAAEAGMHMVLVDYLQTITASRVNPQKEAFQVSKDLGLYLKNYGRQHGVPVVVFAQLNQESEGSTMAGRIQNDKTFYNHGFICIEIAPDFDTLTTTFKIHKDRFMGHTNKEVVMGFDGGRYVMPGMGEDGI